MYSQSKYILSIYSGYKLDHYSRKARLRSQRNKGFLDFSSRAGLVWNVAGLEVIVMNAFLDIFDSRKRRVNNKLGQ